MPSIIYRAAVSLFICGYIAFSLQVALAPGMKIKKILPLWPWNSWRLFQSGANHNHSLAAVGYTASGKIVDVDLDPICEYICGGHRPALLLFLEPLFSNLGENDATKNRFSEFVVEQYNQRASGKTEKIVGLDLYGLSWPKNRQDVRKPMVSRLFHRWSYEKVD